MYKDNSQEDNQDRLASQLSHQTFQMQEAEKLLKHQLVQGFFQEFKDKFQDLVWNTNSNDFESLKSLMEQKDAIKLFKERLESYVTTGQLLELEDLVK